ncbi:thiamine phosphate synthase [Erythrobacter sp. 3-20A1M]|uniref:thiamine phosphate synthase n=1 Tax=Erythrobacter sp. 3-20A1M TaxID=2653850 RepID=UPI001BFC4A23|nr:thiamine phosphate synthase [Erythrobacter sp. 3-20A1M]QWC56579.1 thiamine phosphate synthase [Erythrobacter sp. 3-20A1M]
MPAIHPLPMLWLLTDVRNDARLEQAIARLPTGSAVVFRHYHLDEAARRKRFDARAALARKNGHAMVLSGGAETAAAWGADGAYAPPDRLGPPSELLRIATAHDADEIARAEAVEADAIMLSPVFPTRSHADAKTLGIAGFHALAEATRLPVIALGGMTAERARQLDWSRWAAIDGLS